MGALLEAWGFVRGGRVDVVEPEEAYFWVHPDQPDLHMTVPIGSPLSGQVMRYASFLIRCLKQP